MAVGRPSRVARRNAADSPQPNAVEAHDIVPGRSKWMIDLYHRTTQAAALRILESGFRDLTGTHPALGGWTGVWLADHLPRNARNARGRALLIVAMDMSMAQLADYERVVDDQPGRLFLLPAEIVNVQGRIRRIERVRRAVRLARRVDASSLALRERVDQEVSERWSIRSAGAGISSSDLDVLADVGRRSPAATSGSEPRSVPWTGRWIDGR